MGVEGSLVTAERGQIELDRSEKKHSRRAFFIALAVVFGLFGLLYGLALRMNAFPLPDALQPYTIPYARHVDPKGVLTTTHYVDGMPKENVIAAIRSFYKGQSVVINNPTGPSYVTGAKPPALEVYCGVGESCRLDFHRQLNAPEQAFERIRVALGIRN